MITSYNTAQLDLIDSFEFNSKKNFDNPAEKTELMRSWWTASDTETIDFIKRIQKESKKSYSFAALCFDIRKGKSFDFVMGV